MNYQYVEIYDYSGLRLAATSIQIADWMDQADADAAAAEAVTQWASENGMAYDNLAWEWIDHTPINFSPFATNVLTWVDRDGLITPDGLSVKIGRSMGGEFVVYVGDQVVGRTIDNNGASYLLNQRNVGLRR